MKKLLAPLTLGLGIGLGSAFAAAPASVPPAPTAAPAPAAPAAPPATANPLEKRFQEALAKADKGDNAGAIQILEKLRQDPAATPPVLSLLGTLYLKTNRPKEALAILKPLADAPEADPAVLFNAGRAALALGQNADGTHYLERSVQLAPSSPAARALGLLLAREGQPGPAYDILVPWIADNPNDFEPRLTAALLALHLKRLPDAARLLKGMPADNPRVRLLAGELALRQGNAKASIATLRPLVDSPPPGLDTHSGMQMDARRLLAEAYLRAKQPAEAVKLLAGHGNDPATALLLGEAQYRAGDVKAGLATLSPFAAKILKAERPRDPDLVVEMALTYGQMLAAAGRQQEAADALVVATRIDPDNPEGWQAYGHSLTALGKKDEAAKALARAKSAAVADQAQRAAASAPAAAPAGTGAAGSSDPVLAMIGRGEFDQALAAVREEIKAYPKALGPRAMEVRLLLLKKNIEEAFKAAQAMVDLQPGSADAIYARAACQMAREKLPEAEADLRHALKIQPQYLPAMNDLAVLLLLRGEKAEAKSLLERVLAVNPNDKVAAENLRKLNAEGKAGG
jgi:tetratricopeptide (TPR) repeat protein